MDGTIRYCNKAKGFGFIEGGGRMYFFHYRNFMDRREWRACKANDAVEFMPQGGDSDPAAINIRRKGAT